MHSKDTGLEPTEGQTRSVCGVLEVDSYVDELLVSHHSEAFQRCNICGFLFSSLSFPFLLTFSFRFRFLQLSCYPLYELLCVVNYNLGTVADTCPAMTSHAMTDVVISTQAATTIRDTTIGVTTADVYETTAGDYETTAAVYETTAVTTAAATTADLRIATTEELPSTAGVATTADTLSTTEMEVLACNDTDTCSGHYTCDEFGRRVCNEHWSGDDCATRNYTGPGFDPECPEIFGIRRPCINGQCFDETCCCEPGYEGLLCETDINECDSSPCGGSRGAFCINQINGYTCVCQDGTYLQFYMY